MVSSLLLKKNNYNIFTNNRYSPNEYFIDIDGHRVYAAKTVKYLGVVFDCTLTWKAHIEYLLTKTNSVWNLFKIIKKEPNGPNHPRMLVHMVRALVRTRLTYGQEAFFSAAPSLLPELDSRETMFLKSVLGIATVSQSVLVFRVLSGLRPCVTYSITIIKF